MHYVANLARQALVPINPQEDRSTNRLLFEFSKLCSLFPQVYVSYTYDADLGRHRRRNSVWTVRILGRELAGISQARCRPLCLEHENAGSVGTPPRISKRIVLGCLSNLLGLPWIAALQRIGVRDRG